MDNAGWEQMQAEEEKMRAELDSLLVVHKHGLPNEAKRLASFMGLSRQFQQEIQEKTYAAHG